MRQGQTTENSVVQFMPPDAFLPAEALAQGRSSRKFSLRVAAYIRVSSANPEQEDSYELQERYFTRLLAENPRWTSAGVYSDYALSGTDGKKRTGFTRLLRHAREGRIDRIVSKSISRFARNTSDFLAAMGLLRDSGVSIYFEKENLDTSDCVGAFIITTLGAIAQEESRSISENVRWGFQKRFPRGEAGNIDVYGYRYAQGEDAYEMTQSAYRIRRVEIAEEEAEIVRRIFREVAAGKTYISVARGLNRDGIPAPEAKNNRGYAVEAGWTGGRIRGIISLERYAGDLLLQKQFTPDYLTHEPRVNRGEMPRYYVKDHHPAIVSRELFQSAQPAGCRSKSGISPAMRYPFSGRLVCAHCGRFYHTYNRKHHPIWVCATVRQNNGKGLCRAERIYEAQIIRMFRQAIIERYRLTQAAVRDDCTAEDILHCPDSLFTGESDAFVPRMRARLEAVHRGDNVERDRAFLKRQLFALQTEGERLKGAIQAEEKRKASLSMCREMPSGGDWDGEAEAAASRCAALAGEIAENADAVRQLTEKMERLERYWAEMEADYPQRERALEWMSALPPGRAGAGAFLKGLTAEYVKAFARSITVHSALKYTVYWFDDTSTEVEMEGNVGELL